MPPLILTQTDTGSDDGLDVGCSGGTLGSVSNHTREMTVGGTPDATPSNVVAIAGVERVLITWQSDVDEPGVATWGVGDYVVRLNVTTKNNKVDWTATYICEREAGGTFNTVASLTGQATTLSAVQTYIHTVNRGTVYNAASDSTLYVVLLFTETGGHADATFAVLSSLDVDTPIDIPAGVPTRPRIHVAGQAPARASNF